MEFSEVQSWLESAALPANLPRRLSADGRWKVNVGGIGLLMLADTEEEELYFSASLFSLTGTESPSLFRRLLEIQPTASLPQGALLTIEPRLNELVLYARYELRDMNAERFDRTLHAFISSLSGLVAFVREAAVAHESDSEPLRTVRSENTVPAAPAASAQTDIRYEDMSDEELLRMQMLQSISI